jgi:dinuclear metal center YbgI/SA1388 family protein
VDLLLGHHGLYWDPDRRLIGRAYRRIAPLIKAGIGVYSCHLPLDAHPDVGNNAVLIRRLGLIPEARFGDHQGMPIGWIANTEIPRNELVGRLAEVLGGPARSAFLFGPDVCCRVGVITGGAGSMIQEARNAGVDTFITGEGAHHTFFDASELGMNVLYAGHYATETLGVRALGAHLEEQFGINWEFIHLPTEL